MSTAATAPARKSRRLSLPWRRAGAAAAGRGPRPPGAYAPEALPERQPSLAALVPTSLGRFVATVTIVVVLTAAVIGAGLYEPLTGRSLVPVTSPRFAAAVDGLRRCVDLRRSGTLGGWIGQLGLLAAAVGALVVRQLRRQRLDDRRGRSAAWGWLAVLFLITSCAGMLPLGSVYTGLLSGMTGMPLAADGQGWWILSAGSAYTIVFLWAVLPLYERAGTAVWLGLSLAAWACAGGCAWFVEVVPQRAAVGQAAWIAGSACAAIAMLAAVRSVVREVRGLARGPATGAGRGRGGRAEPPESTRPQAAAVDPTPEATPPTEYIDGDSGEDGFETDGRPLSKSERKRLRKLARMSRAA